jgi:hypothetical protein
LVVKLRAAVDRDRVSREIEVVYGPEGEARLGLSLERLLAGLNTLGVERETALKVVETVAMDSAPPLRRKVYEYLKRIAPRFVKTSQVATEIGLPTNTVRRHLEDLVANGLVKCVPAETHGEADVWQALV